MERGNRKSSNPAIGVFLYLPSFTLRIFPDLSNNACAMGYSRSCRRSRQSLAHLRQVKCGGGVAQGFAIQIHDHRRGANHGNTEMAVWARTSIDRLRGAASCTCYSRESGQFDEVQS